MTNYFARPYANLIESSGQIYVDKSGSDTTGNGAIDNPYLTIAAAYAAATAGDTIVIGPGNYAETLVLNTRINMEAAIPGTVIISGNVAAGAVVTVSGAAIANTFDGINITNLNAIGLAAIGLHVNNTGATITGPITFRNGTITSGAGASCAVQFTGAAGGGLTVNINGSTVTGSWVLACAHANDLVWFNDVVGNGGLATYGRVTGTAGNVVLSNFIMRTAAAVEVISFGNGGVTGTTLTIGASVLACTLDMNNNAGTGVVVVTDGSQIGRITATLNNQIIRKWLGEDRLGITLLNVLGNTAAATTMYTVPTGRIFAPYIVRTFNKLADTGATLIFRYNGTGAQSIVADAAGALLATGVRNQVVVQDAVAALGTVQFEVRTGTGVANDRLNAYVEGTLF